MVSIKEKQAELRAMFLESKHAIGYFYIDNLLPKELMDEVNSVFPNKTGVKLKKSLKQCKYVSVQMNRYEPLLEEVLYVFQDK